MTDAQHFQAAPEIHQTEIDGVPVFWTPVDGPRTASLMFRVGRADEPANMGGITHLVEHLALAPLTQQDFDHNGFVAPIRTVFHATGTDSQLRDFIHAVVGGLSALPLGRLAMERRILAQEAQSRGSGPVNTLCWYRYGNARHGLVGVSELGIDWLGPEPVRQWATQRFTRGNAALWWSGEPPSDLRLELPLGERRPAPTPTSVMGITYPSLIDVGGSGVALGYVAPRSPISNLLIEILTRRVRQELRFERGLIYDVSTDHEPLGGKTAHFTMAMECRREDAEAVLAAVLRMLDALHRVGPSAEEVTREATARMNRMVEMNGRLAALDRIAHDEILGRDRATPAQIVASYLAVTTDDVKAAARVALDTLLVLGPGGDYVVHLRPYPVLSLMSVEGRTVRPARWPLPGAAKTRLILGPRGVSLVGSYGQTITVRYDECVAVRHADNDVRELWGADGFRMIVAAADWQGGRKVISEIDAAIPVDRVACDEHGIGALKVSGTPAGSSAASAARPVTT